MGVRTEERWGSGQRRGGREDRGEVGGEDRGEVRGEDGGEVRGEG